MATVQLGTKAVGSIVKLKENGALVDYIVVHQGKPSSLYDASCDGTWLLRKDILETRQWHSSNVNDYAASTIHAYLNNQFLAEQHLPCPVRREYPGANQAGQNSIPTWKRHQPDRQQRG